MIGFEIPRVDGHMHRQPFISEVHCNVSSMIACAYTYSSELIGGGQPACQNCEDDYPLVIKCTLTNCSHLCYISGRYLKKW